jgi:hypothetical protein
LYGRLGRICAIRLNCSTLNIKTDETPVPFDKLHGITYHKIVYNHYRQDLKTSESAQGTVVQLARLQPAEWMTGVRFLSGAFELMLAPVYARNSFIILMVF